METYSATRPDFYTIERTHDNKLIVRFAEDIEEIETDGGTIFRYFETVGEFPYSKSLEARIKREPEKILAKIKSLNE